MEDSVLLWTLSFKFWGKKGREGGKGKGKDGGRKEKRERKKKEERKF